MLALASVWIGLAALVIATTMVVYRPAMTDWTVTLVLYFGSPGALCFAGLVLWAYRKEDTPDPSLAAQRRQAKVAIAAALLAAAMVYLLIVFAEKLEPIGQVPLLEAVPHDKCHCLKQCHTPSII